MKNKKIDEMSWKNSQLEQKYNQLQSNYQNAINYFNNENQNLKTELKNEKYQLDYLTVQHNNLKQKQKEEEHKKQIEQTNLNNFKKQFQKDKKEIESKNILSANIFIDNFIINEFVKGFENIKNIKDNFTRSLSEFMQKFTHEFMNYSTPFIKSFKQSFKKIINDFEVNKNTLSINHINFIVIGSAGVGKSAFINESLLLPENKRAKEGKGVSVTRESTLYCSEKLKMIRMWDTPGLDYKIKQSDILNEIKRIVDKGLEKGPDHYINLILYCNKGDRFQEEDAQMIKEIMKLYPFDNLPVIIAQLQSYLQEDAKEMENTIREILQNYLEHKIVKKIEIASIIARDKRDGNIIYKARGIPELLRISFDVMGRAITSATSKKFANDIENLCKNFVNTKIEYLKQNYKDEMELLEVAKDYYMDDSEKYFNTEEKPKRQLSYYNSYNRKTQPNYFLNNFVQAISSKFITIFNNLNNAQISIQDKERSLVLIFIQERLEKLKNNLEKGANKIFQEEIYDKIYQKYSLN